MFDNLSDKFHDVFRKLRGHSTLTESNINEALQEIRRALLEADVNIDVVRDFIEEIKSECIGEAVLKSITPGQMVIKIINDKLISLLGDGVAELDVAKKPSVVMLVGLHGSGKTTTCAKLAMYLKNQMKKSVLMVAADVYRPAAIDQLKILGEQIKVPVYAERTSVNLPAIVHNAVEQAKTENIDTVLIDTAGRLQIDDFMIQELVRLQQVVYANEVLLVADSALGQEAVAVADTFNKAISLTGFILTKLDGDARAGAALSIKKVTNCPIKFIGNGEKLEDFEVFNPERLASRILGMGDVVSLVERAAQEVNEEEAKRLHENLKKHRFDYNDFLSQLRQLNRLGGLEGVLKFLPGGRQLSKAMSAANTKEFVYMEAMIQSMTPKERENPDLIDFSRKKRIARGSGVSQEKVSNMINQFNTMRKMLKNNTLVNRMLSSGTMPDFDSMPNPTLAMMNTPGQISKKEQEKRKRLNKLKKKAQQKQRRKK
ncbi:MAG: signal recognition particle protein [Lentisphaeria bacterium]|nr:signal recognition particle protein [Lentisphaeria bacterium]MBR7127069.1 signal recognition particle protein [Lentisphaeria bacterium]